MARWKAIVAYDGTDFAGWQVQPHKRTVQAEMEKGLSKLHKGEEKKVVASGRTDAGVHAHGQVVHFDSALRIPDSRWPHAFASVLPSDIQVQATERVSDDFHARYDAVAKEYRYFIQIGRKPDLFRRNYVHHVYANNIDHEAMQRALRSLEGRHDFSAFCASQTHVHDKVRELRRVSYTQTGEDEGFFRFYGEGFLYNMVRIIVGTAIAIGQQRLAVADMERILHSRDRRQAGQTAPGQGLYLWTVEYGRRS